MRLCENGNGYLLKTLTALIDQKSDWYLDELVAEMEQRTEKVDYSVYLFMLVDDC